MFAAVLLIAPVVAQQPAFKSGVELVRIPVHATRSGDPARLEVSDFTLTEEGQPQTITVFERQSRPVSVCILLDASASMTAKGVPELMTTAVREMTALLTPADEIAIMTFAEAARVLVPWMPPQQAARQPLSVTLAGDTALLDAAKAGLEMLQSARNPNPVLLLITDGWESSSTLMLEQVVKTRRQSEAQIYAFMIIAGLPRPVIAEESPLPMPKMPGEAPAYRPRGAGRQDRLLRQLIDASGGTLYTIQNDPSPRRSAEAFVNELRTQYTLGYTPTRAFDGKYRHVKVEVTKDGYRLRYRGGYLAAAEK